MSASQPAAGAPSAVGGLVCGTAVAAAAAAAAAASAGLRGCPSAPGWPPRPSASLAPPQPMVRRVSAWPLPSAASAPPSFVAASPAIPRLSHGWCVSPALAPVASPGVTIWSPGRVHCAASPVRVAAAIRPAGGSFVAPPAPAAYIKHQNVAPVAAPVLVQQPLRILAAVPAAMPASAAASAGAAPLPVPLPAAVPVVVAQPRPGLRPLFPASALRLMPQAPGVAANGIVAQPGLRPLGAWSVFNPTVGVGAFPQLPQQPLAAAVPHFIPGMAAAGAEAPAAAGDGLLPVPSPSATLPQTAVSSGQSWGQSASSPPVSGVFSSWVMNSKGEITPASREAG
eukprot:TRINITY_DN2901_c0_g2_i2.p1 TRINITY_DN2901_c0_g2~~TRINITY_DN2901_c0_g2_i2.p1  ORF type:complete len:371 (+),score=75.67 TRINITY_DN2901_c0_g2_i2:96-1115(+)